ncbi:MAG: hypothetical protein ACXAAH_11530 [Promethearchaeota archaeon]|jgi:hypothetical protein
MTVIEVLFTILLNAVPLIILIVPLFFIWKKTVGKLYFRIVAGIVVFFLIYWILPLIYQVGVIPDNLTVPPAEIGNITYGIAYIAAHFGSLVSLFFSYPLITLPFIFFVAPFISFIISWNKLRKEQGSLTSNLGAVSYEISESPTERTKRELQRNNWKREKDILKLMIVLLPISLYLLQVILEISGLQNESITTGETALGWFLEILFVYVATFIFSIEILSSSQIALRGNFFGEKIREQTYKGLYTIGAPMSILSIILFIIQYQTSMTVIVYFFAYFIMASIIFILFLDIFEPVSIYIFIKMINWLRNRKNRKINLSNFYYMLIFGALALVVYLVTNLLLTGFGYSTFFGLPGSLEESLIYSAGEYTTPDPDFYRTLQFDLVIIYGIFVTEVVSTLILTVFLVYGLKFIKSLGVGVISYLPFIIIFSVLISSPVNYWLTGKTSFTQIFGFGFYTLRTASLQATLPGFLNVLATPYLYTRYIFNVVIWGILFFNFKKSFKTRNIPISEEFIEKIVYSTITDFISFDDYIKNDYSYLISRRKDIQPEIVESEREEIQEIFNTLETEKLLEDLKPEDENEKKRFYFTIRYLYQNKLISMWKPELSYIFEKAEKQGLYIIYDDGRGVFNYAFRSDSIQDPGLVSGMFSAITSFVKEMTKSTEALKKIDHGDITILIEYGSKIFGALFIKGNQSSEVRAPLKEFVQKFEERYKDILSDWTGALAHFKDEDNNKLVEDVFKEE